MSKWLELACGDYGHDLVYFLVGGLQVLRPGNTPSPNGKLNERQGPGQKSPARGSDCATSGTPRPPGACRSIAAGDADLAGRAARYRDWRLLADQGRVRS